MKKILFTLLTCSLISHISCKKKTEKTFYTKQECFDLKKDSNYLANSIIGNWKWIGEYKYNNTTGEKITKTPLSEGYNKYAIFDVNNKYRLFKDTTQIDESYFKINRLLVYSFYYKDSNFVIGFYKISDNSFIEFDYLKPCNDTLVLDGRAYNDDGSVITFIRN